MKFSLERGPGPNPFPRSLVGSRGGGAIPISRISISGVLISDVTISGVFTLVVSISGVSIPDDFILGGPGSRQPLPGTAPGLGFKVWGFGLRVQGFGFRDEG